MWSLEDPSGDSAGAHRWTLVLPHRERLLRLARTRLNSAQDAEDCVQEALLRAASFRSLDEARVGPFLTSTLLRLCVDHYRLSDRQHRLRQRIAFVDISPDPGELVSDQDLGLWMLDQAHQLQGRARHVVLARAAGLSVAAAAGELGISVKAAESAFTRGRARLRGLYADAMSDAESAHGISA